MASIKKPKPIRSSEDFDLDVTSGDDDLFRWFLLCFLFAKPIQSTVAENTWRLFIERKLDTPWAIMDLSLWELVVTLNEGKYTRYSEVTANGLHRCMQQLVDQYEGSLVLMFDSSSDEEEFSKRLQLLHGIGPKTAEIFLRGTEELFARRVE
ncbi:DNA methylase [Candidatus Saccharibacteria bacterium]|nr:DNA methylase [Candidatus Saccharibacteria bacterium]